MEELGAAGEDAALRWSGDLQRGDVRGAGASLSSYRIYAAAETVRGRPAEAREH